MSRLKLNVPIVSLLALALLAAAGCPEKKDTTQRSETPEIVRPSVIKPSVAPAVRYPGITR